MNRDGKSIDSGRAGTIATLRAVVAGYLVYLGVSLVRDRINGVSDMALWLAWLCGVVFVIAGIAFGWYTWKRWRKDTSEADNKTEEPRPED